jgi:KDO2-lipid IV(A) lauroyltransferase
VHNTSIPHGAAGALVGWLAGTVLRIRRAHVEHAMKRAGVVDAADVARAMYRRLGVALVDLLRARRSVEVDTGALDAALARGPVVIFASHCGNWELAAAGAARHLEARGRALHVVAKPMHSAFFDRWLSRVRERLGIRVIPPRGALAATSDALARGDVVAMPIDQVPDREAHGLWLDFLGAPALVDRAPATVAYRARATVLVVAGGRALDVIPFAPGRAWIAATSRRATAALERHIRADPASWMWLHRRWKRPRLVASSRPE